VLRATPSSSSRGDRAAGPAGKRTAVARSRSVKVRFGTFVREPKENDTRLVEDPEREIGRTLQSQCADMDRLVSKCPQELDGPGRDSRVGQEPHRSGANGMQLVLRQGCRIGECLADVVGLELG